MLVATHLFAWNPALWNWPTLRADVRALARRGHLDTQWNTGRTRAIEPGSRAFLVRLGVPPKGLFGSGTVMTAPVERAHWRRDKAAAGATAGYVMLRLDALHEMPPVTFDDLARAPFAGFRWGIRQSGVRVPGALAEALEALWAERSEAMHARVPPRAPAPKRRLR